MGADQWELAHLKSVDAVRITPRQTGTSANRSLRSRNFLYNTASISTIIGVVITYKCRNDSSRDEGWLREPTFDRDNNGVCVPS
mmetsp:Transcript_3268/g.4692  ORF Transcript_3268/g.4692 Transcript_3268/m.4692 type:complete len:84 (-) Transcript_3268:74-325(-)